MSVLDRIRGWFDRRQAADPADLSGQPPESPGARTGLDRPFPESGPVSDPPVTDPPGTDPDRPLG